MPKSTTPPGRPSPSRLSRRQLLMAFGAVAAAGAVARPHGVWAGPAAAPAGQAAPVAYRVPGQPYDTATGFNVGPDAWNAVYGLNRQFFPVADQTQAGVIWQSQAAADAGQIWVTWFGADPNGDNSVKLQQTDELLVAAAGDGAGTLFTFTVQRGDGRPNTTRRTTLTRRAPDGTSNSVNPDAGPNALNVAQVDSDNTGAMQVANGQVALMFSRTMHQSQDGLNHQSGIARVFDATTLALTKSHGQTSSHSWASTMSRNAPGQFIAAELGDNFPRGVQIHRFDAQNLNSRVVYTFKTQHGDTPTSPAGQAYPVFAQASTPAKTYYQWSNDNQVYTELGGIAETAGGYLVVFAGERPSLDNSKVGGTLNVARDIAAIVVRKDFEAASNGQGRAWVTDDLVVSQGAPPEEGGFYSFTGGFSPQRTKGVVWLTSYPADRSRNASRIKVAPLPSGDVLLLWEAWSPTAYQETFTMTIRPNGAGIDTVKPATSLGTGLRLNPRDDVIVRDGKVLVVSGNGPGRQLVVTTLDPGAAAGPIPNVAPAAPTATTAAVNQPAPPPAATATAVPTAAAAATNPNPPPATGNVPLDVAFDLASNVIGGWNTNAGFLFIGEVGGDTNGVIANGTLQGTAPAAGNYLVNGRVTAANQLSGTLTRDPAGADQWPFTVTFTADRQSFTGSITGLVPDWRGTFQP